MTIVYMTINTENNKMYVGVHDTQDDNVFDGYLGSGVNMYDAHTINHPKTRFQSAVKHYGYKAFKRYTIARFESRQEALDVERRIVNDDFVSRDDTYNMVVGGGDPPRSNRSVDMFTVDGVFIKTFESILEASKHIDIPDNTLLRAIQCQYQICNKRFSYHGEFRKENTRDRLSDSKTVYMYDCYGMFISSFASIQACCKFFNKSVGTITDRINFSIKIEDKYLSFDKNDKFVYSKNYSSTFTWKIYKYEASGKFIGEYETMVELCEELGKIPRYITGLINKGKSYKGFRYSRQKCENFFDIEKESLVVKKPIGVYDGDVLVETYASVSQCKKKYPNMLEALKGRRAKCLGLSFKYIDEVNDIV